MEQMGIWKQDNTGENKQAQRPDKHKKKIIYSWTTHVKKYEEEKNKVNMLSRHRSRSISSASKCLCTQPIVRLTKGDKMYVYSCIVYGGARAIISICQRQSKFVISEATPHHLYYMVGRHNISVTSTTRTMMSTMRRNYSCQCIADIALNDNKQFMLMRGHYQC